MVNPFHIVAALIIIGLVIIIAALRKTQKPQVPPPLAPTQALYAQALNDFVKACHTRSRIAGWWDGVDIAKDVNVVPAKLCLIHSEVSEAMEGYRKGLQDDKLPHRPMAEVELADAVIRIGDLAGALGFDLGGAVVEKMAYNARREDHKRENRAKAGGKKF